MTNNAVNMPRTENYIIVGAEVGYTEISPTSNEGYVLTSNGSEANPSFQEPPARGMALLSNQTASSSSQISFTQFTSAYNTYFINFSGVILSSAGSPIRGQFSSDGGSNWIGTNYGSALKSGAINSASQSSNHAATNCPITAGIASSTSVSGYLWLYNIGLSGQVYGNGRSVFVDSSSSVTNFGSLLVRNSTSGINAFRIYPFGGTFTSGSFQLYGLNKV